MKNVIVDIVSQPGEVGLVFADEYGNKSLIPVVKTEPPPGYKAVSNLYYNSATNRLVVVYKGE